MSEYLPPSPGRCPVCEDSGLVNVKSAPVQGQTLEQITRDGITTVRAIPLPVTERYVFRCPCPKGKQGPSGYPIWSASGYPHLELERGPA